MVVGMVGDVAFYVRTGLISFKMLGFEKILCLLKKINKKIFK